MVSHLLISILVIWKHFSVRFRSTLQRPNSTLKSKSKTSKELKETKEKMKHEFMYLNKKICNDTTDKKSSPGNSAERKKYHFLLPH